MKIIVKLLFCLVLLMSISVYAEVITDGSAGAGTTLSGQMVIPQILGTTAKDNLFHSFNTFNINAGESATFTGDAALKNVISRVTGGNVSNIDGLLKSEIGNANFYFINPAGVTFGANASVNVPAAFYVSTANSLRFADGSQFNASLLSPSNFSTAEPITFGFLNNQGGDITIQDSSLPFYKANTVSLSAHNVIINDGWLINPSGNIELYAVGNNIAELPFNSPIITSLTGHIDLNGILWGSWLNVSGNSAGHIKLQGGDISVNNQSWISANTLGNGNAGTVSIIGNNVNISNSSQIATETGGLGNAGTVSIKSNNVGISTGSLISSNTYGSGKAGTVDINAGAAGIIKIDGASKITTDTSVTGNAGNITLNSGETTIDNGSLYSRARTSSIGNAGTITVSGNKLSLLNDAWISSDTWGSGIAGNIKIDAGNVLVDGASWISSDAHNASAAAGNVSIKGNSLTVSNGGQISSDTYAQGKAGTVLVDANDISLDSNGKIESDARTGSSGNGGDVNITARNQLTLRQGAVIRSSAWGSGDAGNVGITAKNITLENAGIKSSAEAGTGNARNITIDAKAGQLTLNSGGEISSSSWTNGNAGSISIDAGQLVIDGQGKDVFTGISTATQNNNTTGKAGNITLNTTGDIWLGGGSSSINSSTKGQGDAGSLNIYAGGNITVDASNAFANAQGNKLISSIQSSAMAGSTGNAGNVVINAPNGRLLVANDAEIKSSSSGTGNASNVMIQAKQIQIEGTNTSSLETGIVSDVLSSSSLAKAGIISISADEVTLNGGRIRSNTLGKGDAGQIIVDVKNGLLSLVNGSGINTNTYAEGNAGNVTVTAKKIFIDRQNSLWTTGIMSDAQFQSTGGNAGNISVTSDELTIQNGGQISSATFAKGNAGAVNINSGQILIDGKNNELLPTGIFGNASTDSTGNAGNLVVNAANNLTLLNTGEISSNTFSPVGAAGSVQVNAATITLDNAGIFAKAATGSSGQTGNINATATQAVNLRNHALISLQNDATVANPAAITPTKLTVSTPAIDLKNGIITAATSGNVNAGNVQVTTQSSLSMSSSASIDSNTSGIGNAGNVMVTAPAVNMDNASITAKTTATGNAGSVTVNATNTLTETNNATINSSTSAAGSAGNVTVTAPVITMDNASIKATAETGSSGAAGSVTVNASQALASTNSASINSATYGSGKAGDVIVNTPNLSLDNKAEISALAGVGSQGETGVIHVATNTANLSNGGKISVQNDGIASNPANIKSSDLVLDIPNLVLNGGIITAATSGNVNAGNVIVKTQNPLAMSSGASINSNTSGSGSAGNVSVTAPTITLDNSNISAEASASSQGQTGNVTVTASQGIYLTNHANISLQNDANIANPSTIIPTSVTVSAPDIDLKNSSITTVATGNVDASDIKINFSHWLTMDPSFITTSANTGNGGDITIRGGELIYLKDSGFLTSVSGANSNGGNINVTADYLVMDTGVIQANAVGGSGGNINLNIKALIPSQNQLILGGRKVLWQPFKSGFNVIQAASENGVSGAINVTSPQFDISASVSGLDSSQLVMPNIDNNPCQNSAMLDSSLSRAGQGGIPNDESQYGFIPPALISSAIATPPLARISTGASFPCATSQP